MGKDSSSPEVRQNPWNPRTIHDLLLGGGGIVESLNRSCASNSRHVHSDDHVAGLDVEGCGLELFGVRAFVGGGGGVMVQPL